MSQVRLSNLATLSIENDLIQSLKKTTKFYDDVIDEFAIRKTRRIDLTYKHL
jgi:hypothetical protein